MRLLYITLGLLILAGCGTVGAPLPPSANIPKQIADLHAVRQGDTVTLTWTAPEDTTDGASVRKPGKMIVRRSTSDNQSATVGTLPLEPLHKSQLARAETFKDSLTNLLSSPPVDFAVYTVEAVNESAKSAGLSTPVAVPLIATPATPTSLQLKVIQQGVSISWTQNWPPQNKTGLGAQFVYRIMRRQEGSNQQPLMVKQVTAGNEATMVIDSGIDWEKTYTYWVTPVTLWQNNQQKGEVEGDDSQPVTIQTHDVFPPAVPTGLQAVFSQTGQKSFIDLTWIPNSDSDLAGYNVYRRTEGGQPTKINTDLVKTPAFRDANVEPGMKYFYSVSAVDLRNNESAPSQEASETVPRQ